MPGKSVESLVLRLVLRCFCSILSRSESGHSMRGHSREFCLRSLILRLDWRLPISSHPTIAFAVRSASTIPPSVRSTHFVYIVSNLYLWRNCPISLLQPDTHKCSLLLRKTNCASRYQSSCRVMAFNRQSIL